jgi:acetoin utilization deacetylase AcuC-like enzyme
VAVEPRLIVVTNVGADDHDTGPDHPERSSRTRAALEGVQDAGIADVKRYPPREATSEELHRVHTPTYLARLERFCATGPGDLDADTVASAGSWETALLAAGAGIVSVESLDQHLGTAAVVVARPPGHHAGAEQAMGFCLLNNVAVTAAALLARGERVAIIDWDVHHGNGTQDLFWNEPSLLYVSLHQSDLFPGTGLVTEVGGGAARGTTLNVALPAGAAGDALRRAFDVLVSPAVEMFAPTWVLVSAGFDGHRADPLAGWLLTAGDYADLAAQTKDFAPASGRLVMFLEGGYDLKALHDSVGAAASALVSGTYRPEPVSHGEIGLAEVDAVARWRQSQSWYNLA